MLQNSNLQFTNATKLNDPFDCFPDLIDFSNVAPIGQYQYIPPQVVSSVRHSKHDNYHNEAWVCSLSKVYDSLLMWSYYNKHHGICIGLDRLKTRDSLSRIPCQLINGAIELDVKYTDIRKKPDYFHDNKDFFRYQLSTKASDWKHEKEVRFVLMDPSYTFARMELPFCPKEGKTVDYKELRAYPIIGRDCFVSLYLGVNINENQRMLIIDTAQNLNPDIKIYQMTIDPKAFRLRAEEITEQ